MRRKLSEIADELFVPVAQAAGIGPVCEQMTHHSTQKEHPVSNKWHNKGQEDKAAGKSYKPPHGTFEDLTTWTSGGCKKIARDNGQYKEGWKNTDSQKKG